MTFTTVKFEHSVFTTTKVWLLGTFYNTVYNDETKNQQIFTYSMLKSGNVEYFCLIELLEQLTLGNFLPIK